MDSNQKAIAEYIEYRALHDRYPGILTRAQRIDKAATHSFSASSGNSSRKSEPEEVKDESECSCRQQCIILTATSER
jgi:hypothetical protein